MLPLRLDPDEALVHVASSCWAPWGRVRGADHDSRSLAIVEQDRGRVLVRLERIDDDGRVLEDLTLVAFEHRKNGAPTAGGIRSQQVAGS